MRARREPWLRGAIVARTLILALLSGVLPLILGVMVRELPNDTPGRADLHHWLPLITIALLVGVPALATTWTAALYISGVSGLDPGEGTSVALGAGLAPAVCLWILLETAGWPPVAGLPAPAPQTAGWLTVLAAPAQMVAFAACALFSAKLGRRWPFRRGAGSSGRASHR
jgi:hypothetical protein